MRNDLVVEHWPDKGGESFVVKDPVGLKYFRLQQEQFALLNLLDGERSLRQIRESLLKQFPALLDSPSELQQQIAHLHAQGLLAVDRLGQGEQLLNRRRTEFSKKTRRALLNPLYIRLPGWDPERILKRIEPWLGWMFTPFAAIGLMLFVMASWIFITIRFDDVQQRLPEFQQFFGWPNLLFLWATLAFAKVVHEFGHGVACRHFGAECHSMGVMLLVFSPTLYCDVTDSWMLKNKWQRITIAAAGMYVEVILAAVAIFTWYHTRPGLVHHLSLNLFFVSTVTTVIFNANPLLRYDGYYILSDWLEIPNLRMKATQLWQQTVARWGLGIEIPDDPFMPLTGRWGLLFYAIAAALYRWFVLLAIALFLYTVLKPYRLQSVGILLAIGSLAAVFMGITLQFVQLLKQPREEPISKWNVIVSTLLLCGLAAAVFVIPFPWYRDANVHVEPAGVVHVYNSVPGTVATMHVQSGTAVHRDARLITLSTPRLVDRLDELEILRQSRSVEPRMFQQLRDPDSMRLAERYLETVESQIRDTQEQLQRAVVLAPVTGTIIAPPQQQPADVEPGRSTNLARWSGTPLQPENVGALIEQRTHICSIAPDQEFRAVMLIAQSDRADLQPGDRVRLKFDSDVWTVYDGRIRKFSDRVLEVAPPMLSNKFGGPLSTVTDLHGQERLTTPVYQAEVEILDSPPHLRMGMRGRARFVVAERTLASWVWRWLRETIHFHL